MDSSSDSSQRFLLSDDNKEPIFQTPWEAKAFAIVNQLAATQQFSWPEWTKNLADETSLAESDVNDDRSYYERWVFACEKLLVAKGMLNPQSIEEKIEELLTEREHSHRH